MAAFLLHLETTGIMAPTPAMNLRKDRKMSEFRNVTVVKKANVYFDGKVTSRTVLFPDGSKKTLGVMLPGEYTFNTADKEIMEILAGDLEVLFPGRRRGRRSTAASTSRSPRNPSSA